jgi:hypothetical protein
MSEAAALIEKVALAYTTHEINRLHRIADLTTQASYSILENLDALDYSLPATLLVLSEAELRFSEISEKLQEAMVVACHLQGVTNAEEPEGEGS